MHRLRVALLVFFSLLAVVWSVPARAVRINTPAPDFTLKDLQGARLSLSSYRGKVVILNFWSVACGPCLAEIPSLVGLYREFRGEGLVVLGIALDPAAKPVQDVTARLHVEYPTALDSAKEVYFDAYGLFGQPVSVIVDRGGMVREKIVGGVDWASPRMKEKIHSYLKGR